MGDTDVFEPAVCEPMVLWRAWRIEECPDSGALSLRSIHYRTTWPGNSSHLAAKCLERKEAGITKPSNSHTAPHPEHECGIYGVAEVKQCEQWATRGAGFPEKLAAIGEIDLWGRIWRCERGVRGQFARPRWIRLLLPVPPRIDAEEIVMELRKLYDVPVHPAPAPWPVNH